MSEKIGTIDPVEPMDGDGSTCLGVYASPGRVELNTIACILTVQGAARLRDLLALAIVKADGLPPESRSTSTASPSAHGCTRPRAPDFVADPTGGGVSLTRVHSYGRQTAWPGDPDDVVAWLNANGFACRLRRAKGSRETFVQVVGPSESPEPDWPRGVVQAMNAAALSRPDLAWVLRRFKTGDRVVAEREIIYGSGHRVEEGTRGLVVRMEPGGVPVVRVVWDALADGEPYELPTSCEYVAACSCTSGEDDPACPAHGCTCSSVAAHLVSPCEWGRGKPA